MAKTPYPPKKKDAGVKQSKTQPSSMRASGMAEDKVKVGKTAPKSFGAAGKTESNKRVLGIIPAAIKKASGPSASSSFAARGVKPPVKKASKAGGAVGAGAMGNYRKRDVPEYTPKPENKKAFKNMAKKEANKSRAQISRSASAASAKQKGLAMGRAKGKVNRMK